MSHSQKHAHLYCVFYADIVLRCCGVPGPFTGDGKAVDEDEERKVED